MAISFLAIASVAVGLTALSLVGAKHKTSAGGGAIGQLPIIGKLKPRFELSTHRRIAYDSDGEVEFDDIYRYEYNSDGELVGSVIDVQYHPSYSDDVTKTKHEETTVTFPERGTRITRTLTQGCSDESQNGLTTVESRLDEHGNSTEMTYENPDGSVYTISAAQEYYPSGNLKKSTCNYSYDTIGEDGDERITYAVWEYNDKGDHTSYHIEKSDGSISECKVEYDENGACVTEEWWEIDKDGERTENRNEYRNDEFGNHIAMVLEDGTVQLFEMEFDKDGNVTKCVEPRVTYHQTHNGKTREITIWKKATYYEYDKWGNTVYMAQEKFDAYDGSMGLSSEDFYEYVRV